MVTEVQLFTEGGQTWEALAPEITLLLGVVMMLIIPNLGDAKWRIPMTQIRLPVLFGGKRFRATSDPQLPAMLAVATLLTALWQAVMSQSGEGQTWYLTSGSGAEANLMLRVDAFSRLMESVFYVALLLISVAMIDRMPAKRGKSLQMKQMINNRRQADFYILLLMSAIGMSVVTMAMDLFMFFVGLEIASLAIFVLVAFQKETPEGAEGGAKYFIVGAISSAVGLYGLSLLYIWNGNLQLLSNTVTGQIGLAEAWGTMDGVGALPLLGLCFVLVGFAFKVSAVPFHFAAPDAYSGASAPIGGLLATVSKAMGFIGLIRVLAMIASPEAESSTVWMMGLGIISLVTMTWGNVAALGSDNPKRMLAYSSVAHAGYMLAGLTAYGAWIGEGNDATTGAGEWILAAILFHLAVLVAFKLGAFLVLALVELDGQITSSKDLAGLAKRDPVIATAMFIFMLSLAGVPPLAGFMSKFLLIGGIVKMSLVDAASGVAMSDLHWTFWLALAVFLNSAISIFYYLRIGVVMFFDAPPEDRRKPLARAWYIRFTIWACLTGTLLIGLNADFLIEYCQTAAATI
ncbi:MAG: NADH-quinone oxidoreductase subunit N [Euryarchaeota archaeon]|jgi:NADH-quinone oxidoreductase subunit N|nr:NADH-quinone oxidoreductase subunit N [Euryarchaeota archaeon]MBT3972143.1 NADH-quinone oxidoreductase subunit N [Euryarchaeota archaeon]MBT4407154.1 NADH-quinone oxidoreductase subunit N [Euryarchaeota archaeon]